MYGWSLLLVIQTGGMAAVAVTFGKYFRELTHSGVSPTLVAAIALGALTAVNCFGVRAGSSLQSGLMVLKIVVISALVVCGAFFAGNSHVAWTPVLDRPPSFGLIAAFGAAMVPVYFSYGGYQTANFIAGEVRNPRKDLPRGLIFGVMGVVALYVSVNYICVRALGPVNCGHYDSSVGSNATGFRRERRYVDRCGDHDFRAWFFEPIDFDCAARLFCDGTRRSFFQASCMARPATRVPVVAIALQGVWAIVIAISGRYEQILNYVVAMDMIFIGLSATCLFVFRRREARNPANAQSGVYHMPGHPYTTAAFTLACWLVVAATFYRYPHDSLIGLCITSAGVPVYYLWRMRGNIPRGYDDVEEPGARN